MANIWIANDFKYLLDKDILANSSLNLVQTKIILTLHRIIVDSTQRGNL